MDQDEQWSTGKRYFDMSAYWQWRATQAALSEAREGGQARTI
jgi:hypothetical protein